MRKYLLLISAVLGLIAIFPAAAQSTVSGTIMSGGISRTYRLYIPAVYSPATAVPLVFNLHGYGSNNVQQESYGNFRPIADTANFIIVHPNGTTDAGGNRFWNTFGAIGSGVNDLAFLNALIDTIRNSYNIDTDRIYSTGMSNGGFMSYDLACRLSNRIAAIASVTGSMIPVRMNSCSPGRPVPVMQIHGTADNTVPYNGNPSFVPVPTLVNHWAQINNTSPTPVVTAVPDINTSDGSTAERYLYSGGTFGSSVEHYKIIGGGHTWPGSAFNTGVTNRDINASNEIWRFFRQYRLSQFITAAPGALPAASNQIDVYPNPFSSQLILRQANGQLPEKVWVRDLLGRELIAHTELQPGSQVVLNTAGWAAGTYFIYAEQEGKLLVRKLIKTQE